jgi:hypothetical protein
MAESLETRYRVLLDPQYFFVLLNGVEDSAWQGTLNPESVNTYTHRPSSKAKNFIT